MLSLKDFKEKLVWSTKEFNGYQIKDIYSAIQTEGYSSIEEIQEMENDEFQDCSIFYDKNLTPLFDNLNDIDEQKIVDLINNPYGDSISIHYLVQDNMYAMIVGWQ